MTELKVNSRRTCLILRACGYQWQVCQTYTELICILNCQKSLDPAGNSELHGTTPSCCSQETVYTFSASDIDLLAPAVNPSPLIDGYQDHHPSQTNFVMPHPERDAGTLDPTGSSTTLCSLAYEWVIRCNQRGIDLHVISMWMQHGFQLGRSPMEGCRVDNRVLLAALTRIS